MTENKLLQDNELENVQGGGKSVDNKKDTCQNYERVRGVFEACGTCVYNSARSSLTGYCDYPNKH